MQRCLCKYADYIFTRLKEWGVNTNYTTICFLGGGGRIIQSFGNYGSNIHFCDDMKINAKGYEFFETTLAMKQRWHHEKGRRFLSGWAGRKND